MSAELDADLAALLPIAIISHAHPSISKGGAEIAAYTLFQGLRGLGIPTVFVAAVPMALRDRVDLRADEHAVFYDPEQYDYLYQLGEGTTLAQLRRILARTGAKLLNFHHFMSFGVNALRDVAAAADVRTVVTLHEFLAICHNHGQMVTRPHRGLCGGASETACGTCFPELGWRRMGLRTSLFQDSFAEVDQFISPSQFLLDRYIAWGVPASRCSVIENGLARAISDRSPIRPAAARTDWVFGYFGQVTPFKGVDVLLDAAERLAAMPGMADRIELRINGNIAGVTDAFKSKLEALTTSLPFLRFLGPYENGGVLGMMGDCDYILTPSIWWENSPMVIQEAYAAGRPVICTGIGGMAEKVVDGVSGLHFRRGDPADLARVMAGAADDAVYARLQAGVPRPYDTTEMAKRYLAVFAAAATGRGLTVPTQSVIQNASGTSLAQGQRRKRSR
ncbi:MAG: hypothetical protein JWP04_1000 [Belnapia sp.]|nr:hypothetical protein [Belnapia sp.]